MEDSEALVMPASPIRLLDVMSVAQFSKLGNTPAPSPAELALIAGMQYAEKNQWGSAEKKLLLSIEEAFKIVEGEPEALAIAYAALGYVYTHSKEFGRAIDNYLKSLAVWGDKVFRNPDDPRLYEFLKDIALVYKLKGDSTKQAEFESRAEKVNKK